MTETQAQREAARISRETGLATKVIHVGSNCYQAVIVGSTMHRISQPHR